MVLPDREGYVRVRGRQLYYRRYGYGYGAQTPVLVLHGGPGLTHDYLTPLADLAPSGREVVFYDQLGCGRSERLPTYRDYTIRSAADDADEFRRRLKLGRVHLIGHSYGGALALETARRHPKGIRSLVISSGFASMETLWRGIRLRVSQLSKQNRQALLREDRTGLTTPASRRAAEEWRRRFVERTVNQPYEVWKTFRLANRRILAAMGLSRRHVLLEGYRTGTMAGWNIVNELPKLRMPVLVTVGQYDHVTPQCAREIHKMIPQSRLVLGRGQGHLPFFTHRDQYISLLRGFLDRVK
jgi:proline-specific peptidase